MSQTTTGLLDVLQGIVTGPTDSGNAPVMMMLGPFKFSITTAVFRELRRVSEYRWGRIERFGQNDALQYTGLGADTITLPGTVYPDWNGGTSQIDYLRSLAKQGKPLRLITSAGDVSDFYVIERVEETQEFFKPDGTFRKQSFTVTLTFFDSGNSQ
jgi:phage protein U